MTKRLQDAFKTSWKTKNCYAGDVLKMASRYVLKTSSRRLEDQQVFAGFMEGNVIWDSTRFNFGAFIVQHFHMFNCPEGFDIANYADDSTPCNADKNIGFVVNNSEYSSSIYFKWLSDNYKK